MIERLTPDWKINSVSGIGILALLTGCVILAGVANTVADENSLNIPQVAAWANAIQLRLKRR